MSKDEEQDDSSTALSKTIAKTTQHASLTYRRSPSLPPGSGLLHLSTTSFGPRHPNTSNTSNPDSASKPDVRARLTTSLASYPLKLLAPTPLPSQPPHLAVVYTLAYGGGLVAGDTVSLQIHIDSGGGLILLTQGSTKVFKRRPGIRPLSHRYVGGSDTNNVTRQRMHVTLETGSVVLLLPDSISPFKASKYAQNQRFVLPRDGSASVLILDWVNSGRGHRPRSRSTHNDTVNGQEGQSDDDLEVWAMGSYTSTNEVLLDQKTIMRERMVLDTSQSPSSTTDDLSSVATRLAPYHVYATLLIYGSQFTQLLTHLGEMCEATQQFQIHSPLRLIWSYSEVEQGRGGVVRVAGVEVEEVRERLRDVMAQGGIKDLVGQGLWPRVI